jgi:hypothetical protein
MTALTSGPRHERVRSTVPVRKRKLDASKGGVLLQFLRVISLKLERFRKSAMESFSRASPSKRIPRVFH